MSDIRNHDGRDAAWERLRASYAAMEQCGEGDGPALAFDRARIEFLKARRAYLKAPGR